MSWIYYILNSCLLCLDLPTLLQIAHPSLIDLLRPKQSTFIKALHERFGDEVTLKLAPDSDPVVTQEKSHSLTFVFLSKKAQISLWGSCVDIYIKKQYMSKLEPKFVCCFLFSVC